MYKSIRNSEGYSLAETMVSLVIFGITMLGTASIFVNSMQANLQASNTTSAYYQTQKKIDEIDYEIQHSPGLGDAYVADGLQEYEDGIYTISYQVFDINDEAVMTDRIKGVTVTARWLAESASRDVTTTALITVP